MIAWATEPSNMPLMPPRLRLPTTISCASVAASSSAVRLAEGDLPQDGQLRVLLFQVGDVVVDGFLHPAGPAEIAGGID